MGKKKPTLEQMTAERDRLHERQAELDRLLASEDADIADIAAMSHEQTANAATLRALQPRIQHLENERRRERARADTEATLALRPVEKERFLAVVAAAENLHQVIVQYEATVRALASARSAPLTCVPRELAQWVNPGQYGQLRFWAETVELIDKKVAPGDMPSNWGWGWSAS